VTVLLDKQLPAGPWQARIELRSSTTVRAAAARLTFPEGADAKSTPVPADAEKTGGGGSSTMLLVGGGLLLLMLLLLAGIFLLTRKRGPKGEKPAPATPAAPVPPPPAPAPDPAPTPDPGPAPAPRKAATKPAAKRPAKPAAKPAAPPAEPEPVPAPAMSLEDVLSELATADGPRRDDLIGQAASYGVDAIMASPLLPALPVDTARALGERVAQSGG
jgi:outer membrane biosynthesis protein TonB